MGGGGWGVGGVRPPPPHPHPHPQDAELLSNTLGQGVCVKSPKDWLAARSASPPKRKGASDACTSLRAVRGATVRGGGVGPERYRRAPSSVRYRSAVPHGRRRGALRRRVGPDPRASGVGGERPWPPGLGRAAGMIQGCAYPSGHQWSGCKVRIGLWLRLLRATFIAHCPLWSRPVHSGPLMCPPGGGGLADPPPRPNHHPSPHKQNCPLGKTEILDREPKMRCPFQVHKLFLPLYPPPNPPSPVPQAEHEAQP